MSVDRWTITFVIALLLTGLFSWQSYRRQQASVCVEAGGHWDKTQGKCKDRAILIQRPLYRT